MPQTMQQTLVLIKPDALKNSLTGYVLSQLSEFHTGLTFAAAKVVHVIRMLAEEHYAEHRGKFFFEALIEMITGQLHYPGELDKQRVIALVYQGPDAITTVRGICGPAILMSPGTKNRVASAPWARWYRFLTTRGKWSAIAWTTSSTHRLRLKKQSAKSSFGSSRTRFLPECAPSRR